MWLVSLFSYWLGLRVMLSNVEKTLLNLINSYLDNEKTNDDKLKRLTLEALYYCIFKKKKRTTYLIIGGFNIFLTLQS